MASSSSSPSPSASAMVSSTGAPTQYRAVGIVLAISSGLLIGCSFVLKKKGLLRSQKGKVAGEGVAYLKSPMWWSGMIMMITGEIFNFGAYAFVEAILVTPLGALSVVICAIMSHFFLKEKLTLFGWIGCAQCILGSIIIAINGPEEQSVSTIAEFKKLFLAPWFLAYGSVVIAIAIVIVFFVAPRYGKKSMIWYILVCSLIGGLSVSCVQGLGAAILTTIRGQNQFKNWFIYFLIVFVACTLLTEIYYLNVALALFNTAMVTPTYYVIFTFCTLVTSVILYQGLKASAVQILTIVLGFFVICTGIFILQMSKVDPRKLKGDVIDRKTTMLLSAAREEVIPADEDVETLTDTEIGDNEERDEKHTKRQIGATEEPGIDALRGGLGLGALGSVVRARRRSTILRNRSLRRIANASRATVNSTAALTPRATTNPEKMATAATNSTSANSNAVGPEPTISRLLAAQDSNMSQFVTSPAEMRRSPSIRFEADGQARLRGMPVSSSPASDGSTPNLVVPLPSPGLHMPIPSAFELEEPPAPKHAVREEKS